MSEPILFRWPRSAAFGHAVPKTKFYERGNVRTALREKFVDEVQRITWAYKLADDTIRLRGSSAVPEIQVFSLEAKRGDVSEDVLTVIDKTVQFPIIFEIVGGDRARTVAAYKSLQGRTPTIGTYYTTDWQPIDNPRQPLPAALDLASLYEAILRALLPLDARAGETVSQTTDRLNRARKLQREVAALEKKLRAEPQFNRKIEFRSQIKELAAVLTELTDPEPSNKE